MGKAETYCPAVRQVLTFGEVFCPRVCLFLVFGLLDLLFIMFLVAVTSSFE
jgi:hypothetical protein